MKYDTGSYGQRPEPASIGPGKTFVTYMRNFPFFLLHNNTATFAKLSQKLSGDATHSDFTTLFTPHTRFRFSNHLHTTFDFESVFFPAHVARLFERAT